MSFFFFSFIHISLILFLFFFFNDTATTEIYTLSLHDALPIYQVDQHKGEVEAARQRQFRVEAFAFMQLCLQRQRAHAQHIRSEEHTSELQSQSNLVCRLLLEKKKKKKKKFMWIRVLNI